MVRESTIIRCCMDKIEKRGMTTEGMEQYLAVFKYGMPPHGGLGIGLERLTRTWSARTMSARHPVPKGSKPVRTVEK